jgi:hypothetical protein
MQTICLTFIEVKCSLNIFDDICHNCAKQGPGGIGEAIGRWGKAAWGSTHLDRCPGPRGAQESAGVTRT